MGYLIFIDTNVVHGDFYMRTHAIKKLLKFVSHEQVDLCFTEFNYNEIIKKYRDTVRPAIKKVKEANKELKNLQIKDLINYEKMKAPIYVENYTEALDEIIEKNNIKIIPYPTNKEVIKNISNKYFYEKKPFDQGKVSFQDAIIWESIVEYCQKEDSEHVVFISNNSKDFANKEQNDIHEDLKGDVPGILYYNSIGAFLEYEEDNLRDYFDDNFKYNEEEIKQKIWDYFDNDYEINETVNHLLMNSTFEAEFFSGWGTDGSIDDMEVDLEEVTFDIEDNALLISFFLELYVSFNIQTINPMYEKGDSGDGMISEQSNTKILISGDITYSYEEEELIDFVEQDIQYI